MAKLVQLWQLSQPPHLRHLAIVRDTALSGKTCYYVHYSYNVFKRMVEAGDTVWEAVQTIKHDTIKNPAMAPDAVPEVDEYGFPKIETSLFLDSKACATIAECFQAADVKPICIHASNPRAILNSDGTMGTILCLSEGKQLIWPGLIAGTVFGRSKKTRSDSTSKPKPKRTEQPFKAKVEIQTVCNPEL